MFSHRILLIIPDTDGISYNILGSTTALVNCTTLEFETCSTVTFVGEELKPVFPKTKSLRAPAGRITTALGRVINELCLSP